MQARQITQGRDREGFDPTAYEYVYRYVTAEDDKVCPDCISTDGSTFPGAYILQEFPYAEHLGNGVWLVNRHLKCRCLLICDQMVETCAEKLSFEISLS
ncbi:MAG: hypothetical protein FWG55_05830 [Candidatus Bathyarchaeota archaeon]|nr:hypothetical protein [Candidatus Termiticorpusculum sp.]